MVRAKFRKFSSKDQSVSNLVFKIICCAVLVFYALTLIVSFGWGIMNSFKDPLDYAIDALGFPPQWTLANYAESFKYFYVGVQAGLGQRHVYIPEMILNTLLYAGGSAFLQTFACCIMAYACARFRYKICSVIYGLVLVVMMLPIVGALPSEVQMLRNLGLYDTIPGTWVLAFNFLGMYFLVFHAAFKSVPKDFSEAAMIDGAGNYRILFTIMLPLVKFTFLTVMLLKFITYWNEFQTALVYIPNYPTLSYGLYKFSFLGKPQVSSTPHKLAGCMIVFIPVFILFLCFHKRLIGNVSMGGVKG